MGVLPPINFLIMGFLGGLFKKKPGGTLFGNLLRSAVSAVPIVGGTVLGTGANKIELGQTKTNAELAKEATTFAGQPAVKEADGTYAMSNSLNEVNISAQKVKQEPPMPSWVDKVGDIVSNLGARATEKATVSMDDKTLFIMGGGILLLVGVLAMNNNNRR